MTPETGGGQMEGNPMDSERTMEGYRKLRTVDLEEVNWVKVRWGTGSEDRSMGVGQAGKNQAWGIESTPCDQSQGPGSQLLANTAQVRQ